MENTTVITDLNRTISVRGRMLRIWHTSDKETTVGAYLEADEARKIADALDPLRDMRRHLQAPAPLTLDEARDLVARLEANEAAALAKREAGVEALRLALLPDDLRGSPSVHYRIAERAYDRGVRAPATTTTEEN